MPGLWPSSAGLHCGHSCRLETKAWPSQTIVAQNGGDRPASTESWPGDGKVTHAGQSGMAATATSTLTSSGKKSTTFTGQMHFVTQPTTSKHSGWVLLTGNSMLDCAARIGQRHRGLPCLPAGFNKTNIPLSNSNSNNNRATITAPCYHDELGTLLQLGGVMVRTLDLWSKGRGFNCRSSCDQVVTTCMGNCLWTGKASWYITNTKVNSALHPSGVDKSSTGLSGCG